MSKRHPTPEQQARAIARTTWWALREQAIDYDSRICFAIAWFTDPAVAEAAGKASREAGNTFNGGWHHGMACGRDTGFDYTTPEGEKRYAVTY